MTRPWESQGARRPRIAVIADSPDEHWPSMDLVAEMLVSEWRGDLAADVDAEKIQRTLPNLARRISKKSGAASVDRLLGRFARYPATVFAERSRFDFFHVADHSYAQLVHVLPAHRTGVFCHDLDTFRAILEPHEEPRSAAFRAMMHVVLAGLKRAAVVFHTTKTMRVNLEAVVPSHRLVHAPYGIASAFHPRADAEDGVAKLLASIGDSPFVLHVGSAIARKRIDVLFELFARLRARDPKLWLVQQGALFSSEQRAHAERLGIAPFIFQPPIVSQAFDPQARRTLAGLYRRARVVLMPSDAEGFGLPVIEALRCGAPVVASDISTMREAGGDAATFVAVGDVDGWVDAATRAMADADDAEKRAARGAHASRFTWTAHAKTILDAYRSLAGDRK